MADPTKPNTPGEGGEEPKYVTEDQLNKAITGRLKDFEKSFSKTLSGSVETMLGGFGEKLTTSLLEQIKPAGNSETKVDPAKPIAPEESPAFRGLKKQIEDLQKTTKEANDRADAERMKSRNAELRQKALAALETVGFSEAMRARAALTNLIAEGRIHYSDDGKGDEIVFRDSENTELDLASGAQRYAKSEEAKIYMPPKGAAGSGSRPGGAPPAKPGDKVDLGRAVSDFLDDVG